MRYAKNSCLSMKHTASVFRLKRDYKNLSSKEYVENLFQYLGDARSKAVLTAEDLKELLLKLNDENPDVGQNIPYQLSTESSSLPGSGAVSASDQQNEGNDIEECAVFLPDEHVAAVWLDERDNVLTWYLGVINSVSDENIDIVYYKRRDKKGFCWTFPEDDSIPHPTPREQIIFGGITVSYMETSVIRCTLSTNTVKEIENAFEEYIIDL